MCQSKSDGGIRCESHVKKAIAEHQIAYSNLVQQECAAKGITIDPAYLHLTSEEEDNVRSQFSADSTVQKARSESQKATQKVARLKGTLSEALASGDVNRIATVIRQNNPEMQAIIDDNDARRLKLAADLSNATNDEEKDKIIANDKNESALLNKRKEKLNYVSKKEAVDANNIYLRTRDSSRALNPVECLQKANRDALDIRDKAIATKARVREQLHETALANKVVNDPGFQQVASSPDFRNSPEFHKWEAKEDELMESYRMTSGYQNQVAAKISSYKQAGMDTTEMEAAYKALTVRKAKFVFRNIAQAHGASSTEAKAALEACDEAKQKEHVF
jgi:hypothetical protein